jgi:hypothetical protein
MRRLAASVLFEVIMSEPIPIDWEWWADVSRRWDAMPDWIDPLAGAVQAPAPGRPATPGPSDASQIPRETTRALPINPHLLVGIAKATDAISSPGEK